MVADLTRGIKCEVVKRSFDTVNCHTIADEVRINALQFISVECLQPSGKHV